MATINLKKGDRVMIYQKPYSKEQPEGWATLLGFIRHAPQGEEWHVRFDGPDNNHYDRYILTRDATEESKQ